MQYIATYTYTRGYPENPNVYEFRADRKFHWLQKICCWILRKLGSFYRYPEEKCVEVDTTNVLEAARRLLIDIQLCGRSPRDYVFIAGAKQIKNIKGSFVLYPSTLNYNALLGINLVIVPQIDGIFLVEKSVLKTAINSNYNE